MKSPLLHQWAPGDWRPPSAAVLATPLSGIPRAFGGHLATSLAGQGGGGPPRLCSVHCLLVSLGRSEKLRLLLDLWTPSWTRLDAAPWNSALFSTWKYIKPVSFFFFFFFSPGMGSTAQAQGKRSPWMRDSFLCHHSPIWLGDHGPVSSRGLPSRRGSSEPYAHTTPPQCSGPARAILPGVWGCLGWRQPCTDAL